MSKTIFITGASRGFGKLWAEAFLERGDNVVVTSRNVSGLKDLTNIYGSAVLPLELEVTNRAACFDAMAKAKAQFGNIDVVINNAGTGVFGTVEELDEQAARDIMDANLFGYLVDHPGCLTYYESSGKRSHRAVIKRSWHLFISYSRHL